VVDLVRSDYGDVECLVDVVVWLYFKLVVVGGFVMGFGGFVIFFVVLPVNILGFYVVVICMVGFVVSLWGYDLC